MKISILTIVSRQAFASTPPGIHWKYMLRASRTRDAAVHLSDGRGIAFELEEQRREPPGQPLSAPTDADQREILDAAAALRDLARHTPQATRDRLRIQECCHRGGRAST